MAYDPNNSGTLSKNKDKVEGSKQPDYKGKIMIEGVHYWLAGWIKESPDGKKFISLRPEKNEQVSV